MGADSIRQARSDALARTGQRPLTCVDEPEQAARTQARPADKEEAEDSIPVPPTTLLQLSGQFLNTGKPPIWMATESEFFAVMAVHHEQSVAPRS